MCQTRRENENVDIYELNLSKLKGSILICSYTYISLIIGKSLFQIPTPDINRY